MPLPLLGYEREEVGEGDENWWPSYTCWFDDGHAVQIVDYEDGTYAVYLREDAWDTDIYTVNDARPEQSWHADCPLQAIGIVHDLAKQFGANPRR